jgi:adenylate cyclase
VKAPRNAGLLLTALAPVVPQILGSAFNIWYNLAIILPLLATPELKARFISTCTVYNLVVFPIAIAAWVAAVLALRGPLAELKAGRPLPAAKLDWCRRRVVDLPWIGALVSGVPWLLCVPVFFLSLIAVGEGLDPMLWWHLPISFGVAGLMSVTESYFLIEVVSHRTLFPYFFQEGRADLTPGLRALSLRGHGALWMLSGGVCPIAALLLLEFAPPAPGTDPRWFAAFVGLGGVCFGLSTAWLIGELFVRPIHQMRAAALAVAKGDLTVEVKVSRADEFALLASSFNHMTRELREKERLRQAFGLHVGQRVAEQILARDPGLSGVEEEITVMFVDIRNFTNRSAAATPAEVVGMLNDFLSLMVTVVEERHGGIINKFLGDGFMALFGLGIEGNSQAAAALAAGQEMLRVLPTLNDRLQAEHTAPIAIGIGIHTGRAVVGSIGSPQRLEFTAIGSTVNLASRIESLTKTVGEPLLMSEATREALPPEIAVRALPPQAVKGFDQPVPVFTVG